MVPDSAPSRYKIVMEVGNFFFGGRVIPDCCLFSCLYSLLVCKMTLGKRFRLGWSGAENLTRNPSYVPYMFAIFIMTHKSAKLFDYICRKLIRNSYKH